MDTTERNNEGQPRQSQAVPATSSTSLPWTRMTVDTVMADKGPLQFSYRLDDIQFEKNQLSLVADQKRALFTAERMRVDFVYHTAALEGNPFTYPEVKTLLDGITVGGHKLSDSEQVLNLNRALSHVISLVKDKTFTIDAKTACEIQGIVARDEALTWGVFRNGVVYLGGTNYVPPAASELPALFERGQVAINAIDDPILRAFLVFLWGSLNQFFHDGNKRTSRFLAIGTLLTTGLPPLMILAKDQLAYNQVMTRFYDTQDATEVLNWLYSYYRERTINLGFDADSTREHK